MPSFMTGFGDSFNDAAQNYARFAMEQRNADRKYELDKAESETRRKEAGLRIKKEEGINAASDNLQGLVTNGVQVNQGLGIPIGSRDVAPEAVYRPATQRELLSARQGLAVAQGQDIGPMLQEGIGLDIQDATAANIDRMKKDPAFKADMIKRLNLNNGRLTIDDGIDPKTKKQVRPPQITFVTDDGGVHSVSPTEAHMETLAAAMANIQHGRAEHGLSLISGVDKTLGDLARNQMNMQRQDFDSNVKSRGEFDAAQYRQAHLGIERDKLGVMRGQAERERMGQIQYFQDATDPTKVKAYIPSSGGKGGLQWQEVQIPQGMRPTKPGSGEVHANPDGTFTRGDTLYGVNPKTNQLEVRGTFGPDAFDQALADFRAKQGGGGRRAGDATAPAQHTGRPVTSGYASPAWEQARRQGIQAPQDINSQLGPNYTSFVYGRGLPGQ